MVIFLKRECIGRQTRQMTQTQWHLCLNDRNEIDHSSVHLVSSILYQSGVYIFILEVLFQKPQRGVFWGLNVGR